MVVNSSTKLSNISSQNISINGILQFLNLIVVCLLFSVFFSTNLNNHPYINGYSILLAIILSIQVFVFLLFEKKSSDPFILLMAYLLILFFSLRIYTLYLFPIQDAFQHYNYMPKDTNYALIYILIANVFLFFGFICNKQVNKKISYDSYNYTDTVIKPSFGVIIFYVSLIFGNLIINLLPVGIFEIVAFFYNNFFSPNLILLILSAYVISYRHKLPVFYLNAVKIGAIILLVIQTLSYSRSGLLTLFETILIFTLAIKPNIKFKRKYVVKGFVFLPLVIFIAFALYAISTVSRQIKGEKGPTIYEKIEVLKESIDLLRDDPLTEFYIGQGLSRAGYFDYNSEIIANKKKYTNVFSFETYFKSIVDNILTPGFNIFDQPKLSNSLKYTDGEFGKISLKKEIAGDYGSAQFGLYGEMYASFGFFSLPILFLIAFYLKKLYIYKKNMSTFENTIKNILLVSFFYQFMNSFGLDWILASMLTTITSFYLLSNLLFKLATK
jgi:hypothetical protein